ncbi:MAG TPA: protein-glutamate O-methyltransferase CheR [Gemmatimonadales bacterium]|nr:protein-glutamate O-methyltransferase CheR [Gemmatimonadales bacterium]
MIRLEDAEAKLLGDLIETRFGLSFQGVRRDILQGRLQARLQTLRLSSFLDYYHYLSAHPNREAEFGELALRLTNNETYFFREPHHFDLVAREVVPALGAALASRPLRALSAGCSSGEEPYSLAIRLFEAGVELQGVRWDIQGCDVNPARIAQARAAVYDAGALRACDPAARQRYFTEEGGRFRLKERYRRGVTFFEANLVAGVSGLRQAMYDVILCRNLLIYMSDAAFRRLIERFAEWLAPGGYLMLGHSESLIDRAPAFEPVNLGGSIVYRRAGAAA